MEHTGIEQFIPQRPPAVMVDQIDEMDELGACSSFRVPFDCVYVTAGVLQESGLVENIAQTAAARSGLLAVRASRPPEIGYIGGVNRLAIHFLPTVGTLLSTRIRILHEVFNATIVEGTVEVEGGIAASCELKIFLNP